MTRVIIAGGRDFNDYELLRRKCRALLRTHLLMPDKLIIVDGDARGADRLGRRFAIEHKCQSKTFPADWDKYGKRAGHLRNGEMAGYAHALIAFHDGKSKGTADMIQQATAMGLDVRVIKYNQ